MTLWQAKTNANRKVQRNLIKQPWSQCHKCHGPLECSCAHCLSRNGPSRNDEIHVGGDIFQCPHCKTKWHIDQALDFESDHLMIGRTLGVYTA